MTPKRPEATCLIADRRRSPFASGVNRTGSSPPSPVLERPPMRFIAIASVSCASREIEPSDMAPVENRFTISLAGWTSSSGIPPPASSRNFSSPRSVYRRTASSLTAFAYASYVSHFSLRTASWSRAIVSGFHWWCSPSRRQA